MSPLTTHPNQIVRRGSAFVAAFLLALAIPADSLWAQSPEGAKEAAKDAAATATDKAADSESDPYIACPCDDDCCLDPSFPPIGTERAPYAVFEIDPATPGKYLRLRFDAFYNQQRPDRAEFFWARQGGRGPSGRGIENQVDYQEYKLYYENGTDQIGLFIEAPLRSIDPEIYPDTTGFGDLNFGIKNRIYKGERLLLSSIFRTYTPTGNASRGLGTGHVSLEPGLLGMYRWNDLTFLHGEFKFWIPVGGDPDFQGEVLRYAAGVSRVVYQSPCRNQAIIPTLEMVCWSVLDGQQTLPSGVVQPIDHIFICNLQPGCRFVLCRTAELGVSGAFSVTGDRWYEGLFRCDLRLFF